MDLTEQALRETASELINLLDGACRRGIYVEKDGNHASIEGGVGDEWVRLDLEPGGFGSAEGWRIRNVQRKPIHRAGGGGGTRR
jgi:hypothetical protein